VDLFISIVTFSGLPSPCCDPWQLGPLLMNPDSLIVAFTARRRLSLSSASLEVKRKTAGINASLESSISGIRVTRAFANEDYEIGKFLGGNELYREAKGLYYRTMGIFQGGMEFATSILNVLVIGAGGAFVMGGSMDMGTHRLYLFSTPSSAHQETVSFFEQYTRGWRVRAFRRTHAGGAESATVGIGETGRSRGAGLSSRCFLRVRKRDHVLRHINFA